MSEPILNGIVGVWKPKGPSSFDVLREIRTRTGEKRVGHAGTLDPRAEGVLVVAIGRDFTKQLESVVRKEKEYRAVIKLGATSSTDDGEGIITHRTVRVRPTVKAIRACIPSFEGTIQQIPPVYSALKISGKPAYQRIVEGERLEMKAREVIVQEICIESFRWPYLTIRVVTGPGVYIRSLARDIGEALKVGGYLSSLTRTRVGDFTEKNALRFDIRFHTPKKRT